MRWFETLFGIQENPATIYEDFCVDGHELVCNQNKRRFKIGDFSTPTVKELFNLCKKVYAAHENDQTKEHSNKHWTITHDVIGDVLELHALHPKSVFQAASQFNCLEFTHPEVTFSDGVTRYDCDRTQGPACAIACGAGAVYRNYFVPPVHLLDKVEDKIVGRQFWDIHNGYLFSDERRLAALNRQFIVSPEMRQKFVENIKIGWHRNVGVVFTKRYIASSALNPITVTQVYCSAVPISYNNNIINENAWTCLAETVLLGMYMGTLLCGVYNYYTVGSPDVYLTLLGGGAFGNTNTFIARSMSRAIQYISNSFPDCPLHVHICHYLTIDRDFQKMVTSRIKSNLNTKIEIIQA